jgi:hypothetical protein
MKKDAKRRLKDSNESSFEIILHPMPMVQGSPLSALPDPSKLTLARIEKIVIPLTFILSPRGRGNASEALPQGERRF